MRKARNARAVGAPTLLSGLLKCGYCGAAMCKEGSWGGGYYVCGKHHQTYGCARNSFRRIHLEAAVRDYLVRMLNEEDIFENVQRSQKDGSLRNTKLEITRRRKQLAQFPVRTTRLFDLYETGHISQADFLRRRDQLTAMEKQMRALIAEKEHLAHDLQRVEITRERFEELRARFGQLWDSADPAERKHVLWTLLEKIVVKDKTFKIEFRVPELNAPLETGQQMPGTPLL